MVEYTQDGHTGYAGGRFCYVADALIDIEIPEDATPVEALVYDWHEPDEAIRITFRRRMSPDGGGDVPGKAGDGEQGAYLA